MLLSLLLGLCLAPVQEPAIASGTGDRFVALGVRQYQDGDFEAAIFTLDAAVRRLTSQQGREKELARAYTYLGAAFVGLEAEGAAKGKFREALRLDPSLRLPSDEFPPRVVDLFERQVLARTAGETRRGARKYLILGGLAAAGGVGVAAATREKQLPANRPPLVAIGVQPQGQAISFVTNLGFTASASDPDGDAVTFRWEFGDGAAATAAMVAHRYDAEGSFRVSLTASDGGGAQGRADESILARTLSGNWVIAGAGDLATCAQRQELFECVNPRPSLPHVMARLSGRLEHPRRIVNVEIISLNGFRRLPPVNCVVSEDLRLIDFVDGEGIGGRLVRQ